jgi:hypothetical protein
MAKSYRRESFVNARGSFLVLLGIFLLMASVIRNYPVGVAVGILSVVAGSYFYRGDSGKLMAASVKKELSRESDRGFSYVMIIGAGMIFAGTTLNNTLLEMNLVALGLLAIGLYYYRRSKC